MVSILVVLCVVCLAGQIVMSPVPELRIVDITSTENDLGQKSETVFDLGQAMPVILLRRRRSVIGGISCPKGLVWLKVVRTCVTCDEYLDATNEMECPENR